MPITSPYRRSLLKGEARRISAPTHEAFGEIENVSEPKRHSFHAILDAICVNNFNLTTIVQRWDGIQI